MRAKPKLSVKQEDACHQVKARLRGFDTPFQPFDVRLGTTFSPAKPDLKQLAKIVTIVHATPADLRGVVRHTD
jgi:hypothetical protein